VTGRRPRSEAHRLVVVAYPCAALPSADFGGEMQGACLSALGCQLQYDTHPMCEVTASHLFYFSAAESPKRRNGTWKVTLMALLGRLCRCLVNFSWCDSRRCRYNSLLIKMVPINRSIYPLEGLPQFRFVSPPARLLDAKCHSSLLQRWYPYSSFLVLRSLGSMPRIVARPGNGYACCPFHITLLGPYLTWWPFRPVVQFSRAKSVYGCSVHDVNV
jgi:hypothetical protein